MKKLVVIYNPFSGRKKIKDLPKLIERHIDHSIFDVIIWPTEKADDVILLTERAIKEKADIVMGAGGDGTINQIASRLVNTGIALGVIPLGSGNGFARHFKMPLDTALAISEIGHYIEREIDTVWLNRHCMINIGGLGFDAHISSAFANKKKRGLEGYIKTITTNLNYKSRFYQIYKNGKRIWEGKAFMIAVANATQWGNNVMVHPGALPDDGEFNVVILKSFSALDFPNIVRSLIQGKLHKNKNSEVFVGSDFLIRREEEGPVHVDGEPLWLGKEISVNIEPSSLKILCHE
ncbi:MAG: diacylglycerol kinase family lipid kinase [Bacteroidia bacterium]|nr:diacylglycerol kinase family lipid kinase [Bacteroidia bacterium]